MLLRWEEALGFPDSGFGGHLILEALHQGVDGHDAQIDIAPRPHGHCIRIPLFVANH